jgi:two-component system, chemotaxis family, protein-glutamate methylesterase/glutaminase
LNTPSRLFVIGASAGGVEALKELTRQLPADFPGALFMVMHVPAQHPSLLASILDRCGPLPALEAGDGRPIRAGHIYVGVPDRHLLIDGDVMRLTRGPRENRFRPSIDSLFRSAAYTQGSRVVGVVLTGQLDDGTSGLWAIKDRGGVAIVQSPTDAVYPSMPSSALQHVNVDYVVELSELPELLTRLAHQALQPAVSASPAPMRTEIEIAAGDDPLQAGSLQLGRPSRFTCPECHGVLGEMREGKNIMRFRCHTGHAFSVQSLLANVGEAVDSGLWSVLRTMQERSLLLREAAELARNRSDADAALMFDSRALDCEDKSRLIRALLQDSQASDHDVTEPPPARADRVADVDR